MNVLWAGAVLVFASVLLFVLAVRNPRPTRSQERMFTFGAVLLLVTAFVVALKLLE